MFTQRHYVFIAGVIAAMPSHSHSLRTQKTSCAVSFADAFASQSSQFKRDVFMAACDLFKNAENHA